ncbi:iron-containing alcohol dehydrogenase [Micropruina sp.]|uniref:iron-containing alcohol dehydrogenase n=1 Tax=Micropruina sp. TaxID=2737536 RepID=UPI0026248812|nr:iron-containing alcohol dehydrogenase [Micropruina sp.]
MTSFAFATAARIAFGPGSSAQLPDAVAELGARPFVCTGATPDRFATLLNGLDGARAWPITGEPTLDDIRAGVAAAREHGADVVVGLGGGAVLDAAKIIAALTPNDGDVLDYVEVIGAGRAMTQRPLPFVAVPTTAGTGSEVTMNGVVTSPEHGVKVSMRHPTMLARVALVDPELTLGCPPAVTASSGLDALTHCLESFVSPMANPLTDGFSSEGLRRAGRSQRRAYTHGDDLDARTDMALCALLGGLALANAKLGAVHGLAGVVGGLTGAPHGLTCATLLVECCRGNVAALRDRAPEDPALARYAEAGELLSGTAGVDALLDWLAETVRVLEVPTIGQLGVTPEQYSQICTQAAASSSMKGNPIMLSADELEEILRRSA